MSSYTSINSYLLAVKLRSAKTILVEGPYDKKVLSRVFLEHHISGGANPEFLIDDASIVNDKERMTGLGHKDKVLMLGGEIGESQRFTFLVDREWDGWSFVPELQDNAEVNRAVGFVTKGHSIENYWFLENALVEYLKSMYSEHLGVDFFNELNVRFNSFIRFSAAYSLAAKDANIITRCGGLLKASHIEWSGAEYNLDQSILTCLQARGVTANIITLLEQKYKLIHEATPDTLQWLSHGHLGEESLRCCSAHLAISHGASGAVVEAIERGGKLDKLAFDATYIAQLPSDSIDPLDKLISWVGA